jgi:hypothetical protein
MHVFSLRKECDEGIIAGESMYPFLQKGYRVKTESAGAEMIHPGDIIVFGHKTLTCHRLMAKVRLGRSLYLVHKGDHSLLGGILRAKSEVARVREVFDRGGLLVKPEKWQRPVGIRLNAVFGIYVGLYLIKQLFLKGESRLSTLINRWCWMILRRL